MLFVILGIFTALLNIVPAFYNGISWATVVGVTFSLITIALGVADMAMERKYK